MFNERTDGIFGQVPTQLRLWDLPSLDPTDRLKTAMREALKVCPLSRDRIVSDMNQLVSSEGMACGGRAQKISVPQLEKWVAPGASAHVIPLKLLPAFCRVVGSLAPLQALAAPICAEVVGPEDAKLLKWARAESERRRIVQEAGRLAREAGIR